MSSRHRPLARGDACKACKLRKIRCPGERPACSNCVKKKQQCIYNRPEDTITPPDVEYTSFPAEAPMALPQTHEGSSGSSSSRPTPIQSGFDAFDGLLNTLPLSSGTSTSPGTRYDPVPFGFVSLMGMDSGYGDQQAPAEWADVDLDALLKEVASSSTEIGPTDVKRSRTNVSDAERDHLIWLYFTHQRVFGLEMHIATFYTSLHSPDPSIQPHPCLLNAMYLVTCRASSSAALRKREVEFFETARLGMYDAIGKDECLFDAVRAGTLITTWLFNQARFPEAVAIMGMTTRTASSCGLDSIASSYYKPSWPVRRTLEHHVSVYLPPATSQINLAERIYAFWAIYLVDRCATTAEDWGAGFDISRVKTPLPRPWSEYEKGDPHLLSCEEIIQDVFSPTSDSGGMEGPCEKDHTVDIGLFVKAITIMHRASRVRYNPDPNEIPTVRRAIDNLAKSLSPILSAVEVDERGNRSITSRAAAIQFLILGAEMHLYDNSSAHIPNEGALAAVKKMLGVMHLSGDAINDTGDVSLFIIVIWVDMARLLVVEARRLERLGQTFEAASVLAGVDSIIAALRKQANRLSLAAFQMEKVVEWRDGKIGDIKWNIPVDP